MVRSLSAPSKSSLVMNGRGYRVITLSRNPVCLSRRFYERIGSEMEPETYAPAPSHAGPKRGKSGPKRLKTGAFRLKLWYESGPD